MKKNRFLLIMLILLLLSILLNGCQGKENYPFIDFTDIEQKEDIKEEKKELPLRVSLAAITSTKYSISYYEELLELLEETLDRPVKLVQRNTYAEVNQLLRTGQIDLAFICTYAYVTGHDQFNLELVAAPVKNEKTFYQSLIIVHKLSDIKSFADLKNKKFAFTDPLSTSGYLYPITLVKEQGDVPENFFSNYSFTFSHDNSIRAVSHGVVDGAAVDSLVFEHMAEIEPEITDNIRIIKKSEDFASPPVVVRPDLEENLKEKITLFLTTLDKDEKGKEILDKMGIEGYKEIEDVEYNSVRSLRNVVEP